MISLFRPAGKGGFGAQCREDLRHLDRNVSGTDDQHGPRLLLQVEEAVAGDPQLRARQRRDGGEAPGGEEEVLGRVELAVDHQAASARQLTAASDHLHFGVGKIRLESVSSYSGKSWSGYLIDPVELLDIGIPLANHGCPVKWSLECKF